jgi:hypothetical protein
VSLFELVEIGHTDFVARWFIERLIVAVVNASGEGMKEIVSGRDTFIDRL